MKSTYGNDSSEVIRVHFGASYYLSKQSWIIATQDWEILCKPIKDVHPSLLHTLPGQEWECHSFSRQFQNTVYFLPSKRDKNMDENGKMAMCLGADGGNIPTHD